ncbi:MAG: universal stress protein [Anaerolineae bacterium]
MFKRILVPVDGSALAEKAIDRAKNLATHFEAELHFLRVYAREQALADPRSPFDTYHLVVTAEDAKKRAIAYLETIQAKFAESKLVTETDTVEANDKVGKAIAQYAAANEIDLIVMTSHGYTGFRRLVMGSVTTETLKHAGCPVLVEPTVEEA